MNRDAGRVDHGAPVLVAGVAVVVRVGALVRLCEGREGLADGDRGERGQEHGVTRDAGVAEGSGEGMGMGVEIATPGRS